MLQARVTISRSQIRCYVTIYAICCETTSNKTRVSPKHKARMNANMRLVHYLIATVGHLLPHVEFIFLDRVLRSLNIKGGTHTRPSHVALIAQLKEHCIANAFFPAVLGLHSHLSLFHFLIVGHLLSSICVDLCNVTVARVT